MTIPKTSRLCNTNPVSRDDANATVRDLNARIDSVYSQLNALLKAAAALNITLATPVQHGVLLSGSALAATALAPAGTNDFLVGSVGADPAWQTPTQATALINTVTQSLAGTVASAGQLLGTNTNDNAAAGNVGQQVGSFLAGGSAVTLTTNITADVNNIILTAGDWDISMVTAFNGALTGTVLETWIGTATGNTTAGRVVGDNEIQSPTMPTAAIDVTVTVPCWRVSISGTTTYYQKAFALFTVGTAKVYGRISARRVR